VGIGVDGWWRERRLGSATALLPCGCGITPCVRVDWWVLVFVDEVLICPVDVVNEPLKALKVTVFILEAADDLGVGGGVGRVNERQEVRGCLDPDL
jgi:hypothetical protein